ncbi:tRNA methyltransferase [Perkinsela sp. CCAP 1560/4]|nr:tRNA methyltransferase [Perkinsela sp. CCAP 1560/4]|eukprot:KNH05606.1 tRNA methyltransferase [Perkinsela sp. CCAP 1560/4]
MEDLEYTEDLAWKPWFVPAVEREIIPAVVPEGKQGRFVVCAKHNKIRAITTCESTVGEDGVWRMQCKSIDECFNVSSRRPDGERGYRGRYFIAKKAVAERVCFVCASPDHDATDCPCQPCKRCHKSLKSHAGQHTMCKDIFQQDFLVWLRTIAPVNRSELRCVACQKTGHADCSRPYGPRDRTCMSCGNIGHHCTRCRIRAHQLQIHRDKSALDAMMPDTVVHSTSVQSQSIEVANILEKSSRKRSIEEFDGGRNVSKKHSSDRISKEYE